MLDFVCIFFLIQKRKNMKEYFYLTNEIRGPTPANEITWNECDVFLSVPSIHRYDWKKNQNANKKSVIPARRRVVASCMRPVHITKWHVALQVFRRTGDI